jgi:hypothetical protein
MAGQATVDRTQPALVRGAWRAQLAHRAMFGARQKQLGLLAAQQTPPAYIAGDIRL